jgi:hypothetical protein
VNHESGAEPDWRVSSTLTGGISKGFGHLHFRATLERVRATKTALLTTLCVVSCVGDDPKLIGLACPCPAELVCDTATNKCVARSPIDAGQIGPKDAQPAIDGSIGDSMAGGLDASGLDREAGQVPDTGPRTCGLDVECGDQSLICEGGFCTASCRVPEAACPAPSVCNPETGRCVPGDLPLGATCSVHDQCTTALCLGLAGARPMSFCSTPCGQTSDCPLGFGCRWLSDMPFCVPPEIDDPPAPFSTPSGGMCTEGNPCQSQVCNTGAMQCVERCSRSSDCQAFGGNCWVWEQQPMVYSQLCVPQMGGGPGTACTANSACASGLCSRYTSQCAALCCADLDCPPGETCAVYDYDASSITKVCRALSQGNGGRAVGEPCTDAIQCLTEVCVPQDSANPMGPKVCSTTCCTNADCSVLPTGGGCWPIRGPVQGTLFGVCLPP